VKPHDDSFFLFSTANQYLDFRILFEQVNGANDSIAYCFGKTPVPHINTSAIWRGSVFQITVIQYLTRQQTMKLLNIKRFSITILDSSAFVLKNFLTKGEV
jgi:hypothetical protein